MTGAIAPVPEQALPQHETERVPLVLVFAETSAFAETYGGGHGRVVLEGQLIRPVGVPADTVTIFMHPSGTMNLLPLPNAMAASGAHVICAGSRYPHNDSALIMEKVLFDLGQYVQHAREQLGYSRVVLGGWSGGGSLSLYYQSQAEHPSVTHTPAGDRYDLTEARLPPADAVMQLAAHVSRATTLTEWLDASVLDELDPTQRDVSLDLYDAAGPRPPYSPDFLVTYRAAQVARNRKITQWVRAQLADTVQRERFGPERSFVVHATMADPRWLDPSIDPNDRVPGRCYQGDPKTVNMMPAGLARYCSLRSWLSQWSVDDSRADGPVCAALISVPALVVENTADDACAPSHTQRIYDSLASADKQVWAVQGATHYYLGEREHLATATALVLRWLGDRGLHAA